MSSRENILDLLRRAKPDMERQYHVRSLALFGSYARNEQTEASDVDVLVEFSKPIGGFAFVDCAEALEARLGLRVDLVPADSVEPYFQKNIQEDIVYV